MRVPTFLLAALCLAAGGCSSLPEVLHGDFSASPGLGAVQAASADWQGRPVRWGGQVVRVQNRATETWVEVAARSLDSTARPTGQSEGRFFAVFAGFLDPAVHGPGRDLTVVGRIDGVVEEKIGDFPYHFPIIRVERQHFWPPRPVSERAYWRDPWYDPWHDPWYDPWYPFLYPPWYWP